MDVFTDFQNGGAQWEAFVFRTAEWVVTSGLRILLILALAWLLRRVVRAGLRRFERHFADDKAEARDDYGRRTRTLSDLLQNIASVLIGVIATLMVLQELRVNVMPILTGAGILGLAVGFGAQTLVKDFIAGFFIIMENQIRIGDTARINGVTGVVEAIQLRTILLRDKDHALHVFPCGAVTTLANLSK